MEKILTKDKIKQIEESKEIINIPIQYLPEVIESNYLFISYSHSDYKKVYVDLLLLEECGLKFWYDLEMAAGSNWETFALKHMAPFQCKGVIFYVSESLLKSESCIKELEYAKKFNKPIVTINLPFESDYMFEGKSVKGEIFSASQMLYIMKENGVDIPEFEEKKTKIEEYFPSEVIYLPLKMSADWKHKQIKEKLKEIPLLEFDEKDTTIIALNDNNVIEIAENDLLGDKKAELITNTSLFSNCSHLKRVDFGERELYYFYFSFSRCTDLVSINNKSDNPVYVFAGAFYNCEKLLDFKSNSNGDITNECIIVGETAFMGCKSLEKVTINCSYTYIPKESFAKCVSLKYIEFTDQELLTSIDDKAFISCESLEKITIPQKTSSIGEEVFKNCSSLSEIVLPSHLLSIGDYAFFNCKSLTKIVLPNSLEDIGYNVFEGCNLLEYNEYENALYLPSENNPYFALVKIIDKSINKAVIHNDCHIIAGGAFENCSKLEQIIIPSNVVSIGKAAFKSCNNLYYVQLGEIDKKIYAKIDKNMVKLHIRDEAFADCTYLAGFNIGITHVASIGNRAFMNNELIKEFEIPISVSKIGENIFSDCSNLKTIIYQGTPSDFSTIKTDKYNESLFAANFVFEPHDVVYLYASIKPLFAFLFLLPFAVLGLGIASLAIWFEGKILNSIFIAMLAGGLCIASIVGAMFALYLVFKGIHKWRKAKWSKLFDNYKNDLLNK